jgi:hypothetical protein
MDTIVEIVDIEVDDRRKEILTYLQDSSHPTPRIVRYKALIYVLLDDALYYLTIEGIMLECLDTKEAKLAITKVHEGICALGY